MNLMPQQLYWFTQGKDYETAAQHHLFDCIECGACAYACPSEISLVEHYQLAKRELRKISIEKITRRPQKCDLKCDLPINKSNRAACYRG